MSTYKNLLTQLIEINVFKLGSFKLKSGVMSPFYIDLRQIIAYPEVINEIACAIHKKQQEVSVTCDVVCGVPYTALPIATLYSFNTKTPMVMKRKEAKDYGTKKMVEGITRTGARCLIVEDIVSSGSSVIETADVLQEEGLVVTDAIVVLNRMQGGSDNIEKAGLKLHSLFTITDFFEQYCKVKEVDDETIAEVKTYLNANSYIPIKKTCMKKCLHFDQRAFVSTQPVLKKLFEICSVKKSNLCVAADVLNSYKLLELANNLGPHICALKTHIDTLEDFSDGLIQKLTELADMHNFLLFEDRKFSDIGNTVLHQYSQGIYKIKNWAHMVTVQGLPGSGILRAMANIADESSNACIMVAEMSSDGSLTTNQYKKEVIKMALEFPQFVIGYVSQSPVTDDDNMVTMSPGVGIEAKGDNYGQQYKTPEQAVINGADLIIVGRGIFGASDPVNTAIQYKERAYQAYLNKCIA